MEIMISKEDTMSSSWTGRLVCLQTEETMSLSPFTPCVLPRASTQMGTVHVLNQHYY